MDDLNSSPLFDDRHMKFLRAILQNRPMPPISGAEQKFLKHTASIKQLDEVLDYELTRKMDSWKKFISLQECLAFLLEAYKRDQLEDALIILNTAVVETRSAKFRELMLVLDEAKNMPAAWALSLHAEEIENRHAPPPTENLSKLNLEAMRNFH